MDWQARLKGAVYRNRGDLRRIRFREAGRDLEIYLPDGGIFGLSREMILQRIYEFGGPLPRGLVVDAGANVGLFTVIAACHAERVVAIEADPVTFSILQLNCKLNGLRNVECLNVALWADNTIVGFSGDAVDKEGQLRIPARTLDSIIDEFGPIDLLKIDIEGAEVEVFRATTKFTQVAAITGELHGAPGADEIRPARDLLAQAGYEVSMVDDSSLYGVEHLRRVAGNLGRLEDQWPVKLGVLAYLAAPIEKPRRVAGAREMPIFFATRHPADVSS